MEHETPHTPDTDDASMLERHPDWPQLNVLFQFGPHGTPKDFEAAVPHVKKADIYFMENDASDSKETRQMLQKWVADARFTPKVLSNLFVDTRMRPVIDELRGSRKAIGVIDTLGNAPELSEKFEAIATTPFPKGSSLKEGAEHLGEILRQYGELQEQREQLMVQAFEGEMERILEERPELKDKTELSVVITMGTYHTRLRHSLAKAGVASERNLPTSPTHTYSYTNETTRTYAYGRVPSEELLEKTWIEHVFREAIAHTLKRYEGSSIAMNQYERVLTGKLTRDQRIEIYEIIRKSPGFSNGTAGKIDAYLQENQIGKLPRNTEGIDPAFEHGRGRTLARETLSALVRRR